MTVRKSAGVLLGGAGLVVIRVCRPEATVLPVAFRSSKSAPLCGVASQRLIYRLKRLRETAGMERGENIPQRLKPRSVGDAYGTAEQAAEKLLARDQNRVKGLSRG